MFDNLKATAESQDSVEEKETPQASPAEEKTPSDDHENASEGAKTPPESKDAGSPELRFDQHSRFQELVSARDDFKEKYESLLPIQEEVQTLKQQIAELTGQKTSSMPQFETLEELTAYLTELPQKVKQEILAEQEAKTRAEQQELSAVDSQIKSQFEEITAEFGALDKETEKSLLEFALENELTNLKIAYKLYSQINKEKDEAAKKGEEIGRRKANSSVKSSKPGSSEQKSSWRPGQSLDDIISEAKNNLST